MDQDTPDEVLQSFRDATEILHFCPNRLWAVAREKLPKLLPRKLLEEHLHKKNSNHRFYPSDRSHELCAFDFCEDAQRDFTTMPQRHECSDGSCFPLSGLFPRPVLDQAATKRTPTAWDLSGKAMINAPQPYMAISHVWGDGTGPGQLKDGQVHACLFQFFQHIARELHCEGIWWDTVCIPEEKEARNMAIRNMHYNYLDARVTLVHDCFLRNWEWDPETACFGILMSPWFSRGWTALELANSRNVKILFKDKDGDLVIKDLDQEILSKDDDPDGPRKEATKIIKVFRQPFVQNEQRNLNDLLIALGSRHTSWPKDMAIIAALLAGAEPADNQQDTYKHVLHSAGRMLHGHLFHNAVTMSHGLTWCPNDLFKMPQQTPKADLTYLTISANGSLEGEWRTREVGAAKDQLVWGHETHLLLRKHIQHALKQHQFCRLLAEPGSGPVGRAILVSQFNLQQLKAPLQKGSSFYHFIGALYFGEPLPKEDWKIETITLSGSEDSLVNTVDGQDDQGHVKIAPPISQNETVWRGDWLKFKEIFNSLDLQIPDSQGRRLLHLAAERGHVQMVQALLDKAASQRILGSILDARSEGGLTAIHFAAQAGSSAVVRQLKGLSHIRARDNIGNSAIHYAAQMGYLPVIEELLDESGGNMANLPGCNGLTPLHYAAAKGHTQTIQALIRESATIDAQDNLGWTPLHYAVMSGKPDAFLLLFQNSQCRAPKDRGIGWTLLHFAALSSSEAMVKLLLDKGFDPHARDDFGWQPQRLAGVVGNHEIAKLLSSQGDFSKLRAEPIREILWTPLHVMALENPVLVLQSLTHGKFDFDLIGLKDPIEALNFAAENGHLAAVRWLVENADDSYVHVDLLNQRGRGPLSLASENGHESVAYYLLEKGADVDAFDTSGMTPVLWAALNGHEAILHRLLLQSPLNPDDRCCPDLFVAWMCKTDCLETVDMLGEDFINNYQNLLGLLVLAAMSGNKESVQHMMLMIPKDNSFGPDQQIRILRKAVEYKRLSIVRSLLPRWHALRRQNVLRDMADFAIERGHVPIGRFLLAQCPSRFQEESDEQIDLVEIFELAILHGNESSSIALIDEGVMLDKGDIETFLCVAALKGSIAIVQKFIQTMQEAFDFVESLKAWLETGQALPEMLANLKRGSLSIFERHRSIISGFCLEKKVTLFQAAKNGFPAIKLFFDHPVRSFWDGRWTTYTGRNDWDIPLKALQTALRQRKANIASFLANKLVQKGVPLWNDEDDSSLLPMAAEIGTPTILQIFLAELYASADSRSADRINPFDLQDSLQSAAAEGNVDNVQILLRHGALPTHGIRPAAEGGHLDVVHLLIKHGAHYNHWTMLIIAAIHGWFSMAQEMLGHGDLKEDLLLSHKCGVENWQYSILKDNIILKDSADFQSQHRIGSPLWWAAFNGHEDVVRLLIEHGYDVNHCYGIEDGTPLWWAAFRGHGGVLQLLIENGTEPTSPNDKLNAEVLLHATGMGYREVVRRLSRMSSDAFPWNHTLLAPKLLLIAARKGWNDVVQQMIDLGAPVSSSDAQRSCQIDCCHSNNDDFWKSPRYRDTESLRDDSSTGSDDEGKPRPRMAPQWLWGVDCCDLDLRPLWHALENGHLDVVQTLIRNGAKIDGDEFFQTSSGKRVRFITSPELRFHQVLLHYAALHGWYEFAQDLIGHDENLNYSSPCEGLCSFSWQIENYTVRLDHCDETALIAAAKNGHEDMVRLLVTNGAQVNTCDSHGLTALVAAILNGHANIARYLMDTSSVSLFDDLCTFGLIIRETRREDDMNSARRTRGAATQRKSKAPMTPAIQVLIRFAVNSGHEAMVNFLMDQIQSREEESDNMVLDSYGTTLLKVVSEKGSRAIVEFLLHRGFCSPVFCMPALENALEDENLDIAELLVKHAIANKYRNPTPLGLVAAAGVRSHVEFVLSFGVDVNGRGVHNRTALWWAARNGHRDIVQLLLDRGANANAIDDKGRSALWQARHNEHYDVIQLLRERGAR